jgi:hypothetical protein
MINFCEFREMHYPKLAIFSLVAMTIVSLMLLFTRGHYWIDLFGGVIFAHYMWIGCDRIAWIVDYKLLGIPFHKRQPEFAKECRNCKEPINKWAHMNLQ